MEDIETFLKESGFEFHESDDDHVMKLTKKVGNKLVEIQFESRYALFCGQFIIII